MEELLQNAELVIFLVLENLFVINIIVWCFVWQNKRNQNKRQDYDILEMMNEYYEQDLNASKNRYEQISMIKHDMRNTLLILDNLVREERTEEARRFLGEQVERIDKIYQIVKTDNHLVNAILNQKLSEAKEKGIDVRCVILTSFQGIENKDICNLFGNLLDNAIEANEKAAGDRWLEFILEGDKQELEIICRNSTQKNVEVWKNQLPETKKDKRFHGYGVRIIREIVEKYEGEVSYISGEREIEASVKLKRKVESHEL